MASHKMDSKKLERYKKKLIKLKENLVRDINSMAENQNSQSDDSRDISGHVQHMADVATDLYDREFNLSLASNERSVLQKIDLALKKIEDKTFGICTECSKPIPAARLQAIPYAQLCMKCQEELENQK